MISNLLATMLGFGAGLLVTTEIWPLGVLMAILSFVTAENARMGAILKELRDQARDLEVL